MEQGDMLFKPLKRKAERIHAPFVFEFKKHFTKSVTEKLDVKNTTIHLTYDE